MNKVLCTFGWGQAKEWLRITMPRFQEYAERHGYDIQEWEDTLSPTPSWDKLGLIYTVLARGDMALWLDADVWIKKLDKDIFDELPDDKSWGLVMHNTKPAGVHPNCGVWALKPVKESIQLITTLDACYMRPTFLRKYMWEQGALMDVLGYTLTNNGWPVIPPKEFDPMWKFHQFNKAWNVSAVDLDQPSSARFLHAAGDAETKLDTLKKWSEQE